jgi:WD40 repeat protein
MSVTSAGARRNRAVATLTGLAVALLVFVAVVSTLSWFRVSRALRDSETARGEAAAAQVDARNQLRDSETARGEAVAAQVDARNRLRDSLVAQARAIRMTGQPGQHFDALAAINEALELTPNPTGRVQGALRNEAIAAFCLPDIEPEREWEGYPSGSTFLAFDPNFTRYARGDEAGNISLRRMADDEEIASLRGSGCVHGYGGLTFSDDGRFLAVNYSIPTTRDRGQCWKLAADGPVTMLTHDRNGFAFEPHGTSCAAAFDDGSIRTFDRETGQELRRYSGLHLTSAGALLLWNPARPWLAILSPQELEIVDLETGAVRLRKPSGGSFDWGDWHPAGRWIAVSTGNRQILLLDAESGEPIRAFEGHRNDGIVLRFNHRGDWLLSNDWSQLLRVWDVDSGRQLLVRPASGTCLQFSADDGRLAAHANSPQARTFRCHPSREFHTLAQRAARPGYGFQSAGCVSDSGRLLAVSTDTGPVLIDLLANREVASLPGRDWPVQFLAGDRELWTGGNGGLQRWPIRADDARPALLHVGPPEKILEMPSYGEWRFDRAAMLAVAPLQNAGALLIDRSSSRTFPLAPQRDVRSCAVSPDGEWVATGSHDAGSEPGAHVWSARTGEHVTALPVSGFCQVDFSPDGRWLLTTGGRPRLWHIGTWVEGPTLTGVASRHFAFSSEGTCLALSDDARGTVQLVETESGTELARLAAPEPSWLLPVCFSKDGGTLITTGSESRAIHQFDLRAIRARLRELDLDWDAPPLAPVATPVSTEPLEVTVDLGGGSK